MELSDCAKNPAFFARKRWREVKDHESDRI
jgi:hypothetical protein